MDLDLSLDRESLELHTNSPEGSPALASTLASSLESESEGSECAFLKRPIGSQKNLAKLLFGERGVDLQEFQSIPVIGRHWEIGFRGSR